MSRNSEFIEIDGIFHTPVVEKYKTKSSFRMKRVIAYKPKLVCSGNFLRYPQQVSHLLLQAVHVPSRNHKNIQNSELTLLRMKFFENRSLENTEGGLKFITHLQLHENFELVGKNDFDSEDRFSLLFKKDNPLCQGSEEPSKVLSTDPESCRTEHEKESVCTGTFFRR